MNKAVRRPARIKESALSSYLSTFREIRQPTPWSQPQGRFRPLPIRDFPVIPAEREFIGVPAKVLFADGASVPADQQADDDPALEDDASGAIDSEELEPDSGEEEVDAELTKQNVQEVEEDAPLGLTEEADEPENPADVDDDGDGVINEFDECPNTARAVRVDATGCVTDLASEDGSDDGVSVLAPPATDDLNDEVIAGVCGQGLGLFELSCMLSFAALFSASGRRRSRRVSSVSRR